MEADLAFRGVDLRDLYRPGGGTTHLTLRRVLVLIRNLPPESATARASGGHGFSDVELRVMEIPRLMGGALHPFHPARDAERAAEVARVQHLRDRVAYYRQRGQEQRAAAAAASGRCTGIAASTRERCRRRATRAGRCAQHQGSEQVADVLQGANAEEHPR